MKRALLVGVDEYDLFPSLTGCCNDVRALEPLLRRNENEEPNFSCNILTSDRGQVTRDNLLANLRKLLNPAGSVALLYFAGHGYRQDNDVDLVTSDGTEKSPGVALSQVLSIVQSSRVPEIVLILDACFSGAAGGVPQLGSASSTLRPGVSILSASQDGEAAGERGGRGVFSSYLEDALRGGAADLLGRVTVAGVYAYLSEMFGPWDQRPTFKANIDQLHELRQTRPDISRPRLRELAALFPRPDYHLPLDPSYEPTEEPRDLGHEADFALLQAARAVKLVEPVSEEHLYFAALHSTACRLTRTGQHYWKLAREGRL
ncbi:caspase domain-containing protein [Frankia sp. AgB32]|uniref:caspase family protein n=1 Tax=Frankia sp. AgB32 TaxID=631119 RepID=UPI00201077A1|nr:caspase family protein [Frankia sp. AgB32]MCK9896055.1 caspase family protein [Frankia sp. AgB32]